MLHTEQTDDWNVVHEIVVLLKFRLHVFNLAHDHQIQPSAPLCPIPVVGEPFERVLVYCLGPLLCAKSGCQYLLMIICVATQFPEAIPLRNISAKTVTVSHQFFKDLWTDENCPNKSVYKFSILCVS